MYIHTYITQNKCTHIKICLYICTYVYLHTQCASSPAAKHVLYAYMCTYIKVCIFVCRRICTYAYTLKNWYMQRKQKHRFLLYSILPLYVCFFYFSSILKIIKIIMENECQNRLTNIFIQMYMCSVVHIYIYLCIYIFVQVLVKSQNK